MAIMGLAKLFRYHTDETLEIVIVKSETYSDESINDIGIDPVSYTHLTLPTILLV